MVVIHAATYAARRALSFSEGYSLLRPRWTVTRAATRGLVGFIAAASVDANGARGGGSRSGAMHGGHGERYTQRDVESFWGDLLARNIALLRRSWSSLELVVGIPWLARERQRQRRLYERQRRGRACLASGGAADRPTLSRARQCFELAHAAYSAYDEDLSALDRFLLETSVRAEEVHYLQPTSMFIELAPVPGHLVVTAHEIKAVVLVIRGTEVRDKSGQSWVPVDVMADLAASATPFLGGHAHEGMALAAEQLRLMHGDRLAEALAPLLSQNYELHIIGHSLGAGVAILLTLLLDLDPRFTGNVRCTAFSPPPVLSLELARSSAALVDSFIVEDDIIPRLSIASINRLHDELAEYAWQRGARDELRAEVVFQLTGNRSEEDEVEQQFSHHLLQEAPQTLFAHQSAALHEEEAALAAAAEAEAAAVAEVEAVAKEAAMEAAADTRRTLELDWASYPGTAEGKARDLRRIVNESMDDGQRAAEAAQRITAGIVAVVRGVQPISSDQPADRVATAPPLASPGMPTVRPIITSSRGVESRPSPRRSRDRKLSLRRSTRMTGLDTAQDPPWRPRLRAGRYTNSATDSANEQDEPARADEQESKRKSLKVISALDWHKERHGSMERPSFANNIVHIAAASSHTHDVAANAEAALLGAHSSWEPNQPKEETKQATAAAPFVNDASSAQPSDANSDATQPKQGEEVERWWKWWFSAAVKKKEKVAVLLEQEQADNLASMDFPCKLDKQNSERAEQHTEGADQRPPLVHASNYRDGDHYRHACMRPVVEASVELFPPGKLFHLVSNGIREESLGGRILVKAADQTMFSEIPLTVTSITNHNPMLYEKFLKRAQKFAPEWVEPEVQAALFRSARDDYETTFPNDSLPNQQRLGSYELSFEQRMRWANQCKLV